VSRPERVIIPDAARRARRAERVSVQGKADEDEVEPPLPPGLDALPAPLARFAEFLRIDEDLIAAAAEASRDATADRSGLAAWLTALPEREKDELLLEFVEVQARTSRRRSSREREGATAKFETRVASLANRYARRPAFVGRLEGAGLVPRE
jgi:hypothetical protein